MAPPVGAVIRFLQIFQENCAMSTVAAPAVSGCLFIDGLWHKSTSCGLESHNPAHWDEIIGAFPFASAEEVDQAVMAARQAFPAWRRTSRIHRAELFDNLAQLVK